MTILVSKQRTAVWEEVVSNAVYKKERKSANLYQERSLFLFYGKSKFRINCIWMMEHPMFQLLIISTIIVNCFVMFATPAYSDLVDDDPIVPEWISTIIDYVSTLIFTFEFIVSVVSLGLIGTKHAYWKSGWNVMDTFVLGFSWFDIVAFLAGMDSNNLAAAKVFRLFRALRPLRLMKRNEGMRVVIDALMATTAPVIYVIVYSIICFIVFGLVGMGLMGGKMFYCTMPGAEYPEGKAMCSGESFCLSILHDTLR